MADNVTLPAQGTGTSTPVVATKDIGSAQHQQVIVGGGVLLISQTPTISTSAYTAKDAVGGKLTFASAARWSGAGGLIVGLSIDDLDQERAPLELVLFNQDFTASSDNAVFDPSDADLANLIAVIPLTQYFDFNDNAAGYVGNLAIPYACVGGTSLYGQLVTRGTPTYTATSDLVVKLHVLRD